MAHQTIALTSSVGPKPAECRHSLPEMPITLPEVGLFRFKQFAAFLPFSRETWRKLVLEGKAPAPIRMGGRCTVWPASELHKFFHDPANYRTERPSEARRGEGRAIVR